MADQLPTPTYLLKTALHLAPAPLLNRGLQRIITGMDRQHTTLFKRLKRLGPATILFNPKDTPQAFLLTITAETLSMQSVVGNQSADVVIKGKLAALLDLLEGYSDFDTAFFNRDVTMTGNTAIAIGFRNTLDGETMSLLGDALALSPIPEEAGRKIIFRIDKHIKRAEAHFSHISARLKTRGSSSSKPTSSHSAKQSNS